MIKNNNPLLNILNENLKQDLILHPEIIKKEVDPVRREILKQLRRKLIVGRKVSKAMAKGPDFYASYLPDGTKVAHDVIPGESELSKWNRLPRPWARFNDWKDDSIVTRAIGRNHGKAGPNDHPWIGKYRREHFDEEAKERIRQAALDSPDILTRIENRRKGDFIRKWREKHPNDVESYF